MILIDVELYELATNNRTNSVYVRVWEGLGYKYMHVPTVGLGHQSANSNGLWLTPKQGFVTFNCFFVLIKCTKMI